MLSNILTNTRKGLVSQGEWPPHLYKDSYMKLKEFVHGEINTMKENI